MRLSAFLWAAFALAQPPAIPDTPAARQFTKWLEVFNRGDRAELTAYLNQNFVTPRPDAQADFRDQTGGFELIKFEDATATAVHAIVKEREGDNYARAEMEVEAQPPYKVAKFGARVIPPPAGVPPAPRMSEQQALEALRAQLDRRAAEDKFAGAVLVARNGKTLFGEARGLADRDKQVANKLGTRFHIGSMNKMFTAVAVAQLAQAGKLKFDDPLGKYLTGYPNRDVAAKVTLHHLLTHTGGTGDFFGPEFDKNRLKLRTLQDYVDLYGKRGLEFEPGSRWQYSNYGFLLLGVVVEKVSGQSYYDYVRDHVYKPAGMTRTDSLPEAEQVEDRAVGYMKRGGKWVANWDTLPVRGTSAGGGYSTVEDLARFAHALLTNKLLDKPHTDLVMTGKVQSGPMGKYAYGFGDFDRNGVRSVGHGGGAPGMNGDLAIFPDSGYVVAALANLDPPAASRMAEYVASRLPLK